ncbi:MAG: small-conductance mechanosensitive channel [Candidatus Azotimanducaceae bacterium]|jgi:small-conductance mechanosensitive channel
MPIEHLLTEYLLTASLVVIYILATQILRRVLKNVGERKQAAPQRAIYISKVFNFGLVTVGGFLLSLIWGLDYDSVFVLASSVLAVLGVAFFAQWSILSNITASIVIFFSYSARIGDLVRIVDGDNSLEGEILDINLFQVLLRDPRGDLINYPNNLIIQKPLVKIAEFTVPAEELALPKITTTHGQ